MCLYVFVIFVVVFVLYVFVLQFVVGNELLVIVVDVIFVDEKLFVLVECVYCQLCLSLGDYMVCMKEIFGVGVQMVVVLEGGEVCGIIVFCIFEKMYLGCEFYCDDFVVDEVKCLIGVGYVFVDYMECVGCEWCCDMFVFDLGMQCQQVYKFYFCEGMVVILFYFNKKFV